jgi:hypothetical protein
MFSQQQIEAAAKAIWEARHKSDDPLDSIFAYSWESEKLPIRQWAAYRALARAALKAVEGVS